MGINTLLAVDLASAACREIYVSSPTYLYFLFFTHSVLLLFSLSPYWAVLILVPFFSGQIVSERSTMIFVKLLFLFVYITFIYICIHAYRYMYLHNTFASESNINRKVEKEGISIHSCHAEYGK